MKLRKIVSLVLALMLCCMSIAFAQTATPSENPLDMEVMIGATVYNFSCTLDELEAQGITITDSELRDGYWHNANNGRAAFQVLLMGTKGDGTDLSVCGVKIEPDGSQTFVLPCGIVMGESTYDDCLAAYGAPDNISAFWVEFARDKVQYRIYFDDNNVIREMQMISYGPLSWGFEFDDQAGVEQENLPDPFTMAFDEYILDGKLYKGQITLADLEENGWVLDHAADLSEEIAPQGNDLLINNSRLVLFNGESTLQVFPINRSTEETCTLAECSVLYIGVNSADNVSLVLADGITIGSSYDDVIATFGEATSEEDYSDDGYIYYKHKAMGSVTYGFSVADGEVIYIRVQP